MTDDGYTLVLHRISGNEGKHPVLLVHGMCMSDECFVYDEKVSLAAYLHVCGYDVWLGNNRGNKYSWQHIKNDRHEKAYWNYTLDQLAKYDVPTMLNTVLAGTYKEKLTYIGFSNGAGQFLASFHHCPSLIQKIEQAILIAPALKIRDITNHKKGIVIPLLQTRYLFFKVVFGEQCFVSCADQWKRILQPNIFTWIIDKCLWTIFGWHLAEEEVPYHRRQLFYNHLYSSCASKLIHHWFQIIKHQKFHPYYER